MKKILQAMFGLVMFCILPFVLGDHSLAGLLANTAFLSLGIFLIMLFRGKSRYTIILPAFFLALYFVLYYVQLLYWLYTGFDLDPFYVFDYRREVFDTLTQMFGIWRMAGMLIGLPALGVGFFFWWYRLGRQMTYRWYQPLLYATCVLVFLLIGLFPEQERVIRPVARALQQGSATRNSIPFVTMTIQPLQTTSTENIFILQLESINALAAHGRLTVDGTLYEGDYIPHMRAVGRDGVFFPLVWANETNTNRAQEVFLCGIVGNIGTALSHRLGELSSPCLPEILARAGYTPIVFRSDNLEFANQGAFFKKMGFKEVHHSDIMKDGDVMYEWGYDDCVFYQRAFEYLKEHYSRGEKLFVYFEVSSHHVPFNWPKPPYQHLHAFKNPSNLMENYLNSLLEQDFCVQKFYENYQSYHPDNTHLLVMGDHSWPMKSHEKINTAIKSTNPERTLTSMAYIPPASQKEQFRVGAEENHIFSQENIIPTILELLSGKPIDQSIAFTLRKDAERPASHQDCHLLTQAYHPTYVTVVRDQKDVFKYNVTNQEVYYSDLKTDLSQENTRLIRSGIDLRGFVGQYYCGKHNKNGYVDKMPRSEEQPSSRLIQILRTPVTQWRQ